MNKLFTIFYYLLALAALGLGALLVLMQTDIMPGYDVRIVQSGSMEPAIMTGSVVVIQDRERYEVDDVITFGGSDSATSLPTTHRVVETIVQDGELAYITKGDANTDRDQQPVREGDVRGTVLFSIPYLGYILDFARQPLGFALLIGIPAAFIVFEEASNIYGALRTRRPEETEVDEDGDSHTAGPEMITDSGTQESVDSTDRENTGNGNTTTRS